MNYGQFPSDVDTREVSLRQFYPGCRHIISLTICRESLPDYQQQSDGTFVCLQAPDECANCLMAKEPALPAQKPVTTLEESAEGPLDELFGA